MCLSFDAHWPRIICSSRKWGKDGSSEVFLVQDVVAEGDFQGPVKSKSRFSSQVRLIGLSINNIPKVNADWYKWPV